MKINKDTTALELITFLLKSNKDHMDLRNKQLLEKGNPRMYIRGLVDAMEARNGTYINILHHLTTTV